MIITIRHDDKFYYASELKLDAPEFIGASPDEALGHLIREMENSDELIVIVKIVRQYN